MQEVKHGHITRNIYLETKKRLAEWRSQHTILFTRRAYQNYSVFKQRMQIQTNLSGTKFLFCIWFKVRHRTNPGLWILIYSDADKKKLFATK